MFFEKEKLNVKGRYDCSRKHPLLSMTTTLIQFLITVETRMQDFNKAIPYHS